MKRLILIAAIPLAVSLVVPALSAPGDYNDDGTISREEFRNQAAKAAFAADKNKNGFIDTGEYPLNDEQRRALDGDADGKVSVEEFQAGQVAGFDALDKNRNGTLDASEKGR